MTSVVTAMLFQDKKPLESCFENFFPLALSTPIILVYGLGTKITEDLNLDYRQR